MFSRACVCQSRPSINPSRNSAIYSRITTSQTSLRSQQPILFNNVASRTCPSSISPTSSSASPSRASSTHIMTGRCATNLFPASVAWKPGRRSSLFLSRRAKPSLKFTTYKLALAKETAKKAADQISSSVVDDQSRSAAAPVHGVRQKFRRDRPSGRGSAEARSSSQQTSRKPCYRCDRHGHSPAECFYKQAKWGASWEKVHNVQIFTYCFFTESLWRIQRRNQRRKPLEKILSHHKVTALFMTRIYMHIYDTS